MPLFNRLAADERVAVKVFLGATSEPDRQWPWPTDVAFDYEVGSLLTVPRRGGRKPAYVAPGIALKLASFRPDVVVAGGLALGLVGCLSSQLTGARFYVWLDATMESDFAESPAWNRSLRRRLVCAADGCIASSTLAAEYLRLMGVPADRVHLSLLSVDVERLSRQIAEERESSRAEWSSPNAPTRLLYVGQMKGYKGVDLLVRAYRELMRRHANCELVCVGDGPLRSRVAGLSGFHPDWRIQVLGHLQPGELPRVWARADVFCLFSRAEAYGAVVAEALAAGLPIVCSEHAGASRDLVIEGENGHVVDPFDTLVCADVLRRLVLDGDTRARMGRRSLQLSSLCSSESGAESFMSAVGIHHGSQ